MSNCYFCSLVFENPSVIFVRDGVGPGSVVRVTCPECGQYIISSGAANTLNNLNNFGAFGPSEIAIFQHWIKENPQTEITDKIVKDLLQ